MEREFTSKKSTVPPLRKNELVRLIRGFKDLEKVDIDIHSPTWKKACKSKGYLPQDCIVKSKRDFVDPRDKELTKLKYQNYLNRIIPMLNEIIEERAHLRNRQVVSMEPLSEEDRKSTVFLTMQKQGHSPGKARSQTPKVKKWMNQSRSKYPSMIHLNTVGERKENKEAEKRIYEEHYKRVLSADLKSKAEKALENKERQKKEKQEKLAQQLEKKKEKVITLLDEEKKKGNEKIKEYDRIQRERDQQAKEKHERILKEQKDMLEMKEKIFQRKQRFLKKKQKESQLTEKELLGQKLEVIETKCYATAQNHEKYLYDKTKKLKMKNEFTSRRIQEYLEREKEKEQRKLSEYYISQQTKEKQQEVKFKKLFKIWKDHLNKIEHDRKFKSQIFKQNNCDDSEVKIAKINDKLKRAEQNVKKFKEETEKKVRYNNEISKMKYLNVVENKERQRRIQKGKLEELMEKERKRKEKREEEKRKEEERISRLNEIAIKSQVHKKAVHQCVETFMNKSLPVQKKKVLLESMGMNDAASLIQPKRKKEDEKPKDEVVY